ncbi:hypothetical protein U9M48_032358 [Paspalum notatum var. saurae]|uniref:HMA domain-containing protein n=1 Tax=Paspalum notatum var. saurae TaxID=547442 RepID=A0AAQ3U966_PASNO
MVSGQWSVWGAEVLDTLLLAGDQRGKDEIPWAKCYEQVESTESQQNSDSFVGITEMGILVITLEDPECCRCRATITKVLDGLKEDFCIEKVEFDDKEKKVIVRGKFDAAKLQLKICAGKACKIIKEMKIVEVWPPPKDDKEKEKEKKEKEKEKEKEPKPVCKVVPYPYPLPYPMPWQCHCHSCKPPPPKPAPEPPKPPAPAPVCHCCCKCKPPAPPPPPACTCPCCKPPPPPPPPPCKCECKCKCSHGEKKKDDEKKKDEGEKKKDDGCSKPTPHCSQPPWCWPPQPPAPIVVCYPPEDNAACSIM